MRPRCPSAVRLFLLGALAALGLARCAAAPPPPPVAPPPVAGRADLVVLLPGQGPAAIILTEPDGRTTVLDTPYAGAHVGPDARLVTGPVAPEEVRAVFAEALAAQPPRPVTFTLYFVEATDQFAPESAALLDRIVASIAARPAPEIAVTGHTDGIGSDAFNDVLSQRRADRVKALLVSRGIPASSIVATGRGKREPRVPAPNGVAEPRNRRVEITVR